MLLTISYNTVYTNEKEYKYKYKNVGRFTDYFTLFLSYRWSNRQKEGTDVFVILDNLIDVLYKKYYKVLMFYKNCYKSSSVLFLHHTLLGHAIICLF